MCMFGLVLLEDTKDIHLSNVLGKHRGIQKTHR